MSEDNTSQNEVTESAQSVKPIQAAEPSRAAEAEPATEQQLQEIKQEMSAFERSTLRWTKVTCGVFAVTLVFIALQWSAIRSQLEEMKSGGKDTHELAVAAGKQATKTETLATETHSLAVAANASAQAAKDGNDIARTASRSVQRAFIVVDHLEIFAERSQSGSVVQWIVNPVVTNSGNTPTVNLYFQIGFGGGDMTHWPANREPPFDPPNFPSLAEIRNHHTNWQRGIVGPHANVTNFTVLNGFTADGLHGPGSWTNTGEFTWGSFIYGDVFDNRPTHITEFCFVMNRTSMVNDQFAPYGRCNHHNCADEECEAENRERPN